MTAAGIAFIAGGIATLICLRSVLFGRAKPADAKPVEGRPALAGGRPERSEERAEQRQLEQRGLEQRPAELRRSVPREQGLPTARRASWVEIDRTESRRPETPRQNRRHAGREDDLPAAIGLPAGPEVTPEPEPETNPLVVTPGEEESRPISVRRVDRSDPAYGSRVDGWVRPEYHDDPPETPSGEYWTPVPMDALDLPEDDPEPSARGYGWPTQVERLPAVPDYEPATGFDLTPVASEPTEFVPTWPPVPDERRRRTKRRRRLDGGPLDDRRRRLDSGPLDDRRRPDVSLLDGGPSGDGLSIDGPLDKPRRRPDISLLDGGLPDGGLPNGGLPNGGLPSGAPPAEDLRGPDGSRPEDPDGVADDRLVRLPTTWAGRDTKPSGNRFLDNEPRRTRPEDDQRFHAPTGEPERRRPRPRPRPTASVENPYVSRHAADPPR